MSDKPTKKSEIKPRPDDVCSPDAIIKAMYETISGPAGKKNWYRLRSLYLDGARLIPIGKRIHKDADFRIMSIEEWIEDAAGYLAQTDFYETEIMCHMDRFGDIDVASQDVVIEVVRKLEEQQWMLRAQLVGRA